MHLIPKLARLESDGTFAAAQYYFEKLLCERRRGGERQRTEQNIQWRRRRPPLAGRAQAEWPPALRVAGPWWDERRTAARPRNSGKVQRLYPSWRR